MDSFSLVIGQATVLRWLYFVCVMILLQPLANLRDLIRFNVTSTTVRNRASFDPCLLCVPPNSKICANSFYDRSSMYAAPTLWNVLELYIRLLPSDDFK